MTCGVPDNSNNSLIVTQVEVEVSNHDVRLKSLDTD